MITFDEMEYERPYPMTEVDPRSEIYCSKCGKNSPPKPAELLTVIRHEKRGSPGGHYMWYCPEHVPLQEWGGSWEVGSPRRNEVQCPRDFILVASGTPCPECGDIIG